VSRPNNHLRIKANRDQDRGIVRPAQILNIIIMPDQSPNCAPIFNRRCLVRSYTSVSITHSSLLQLFQNPATYRNS
jgi:hypothetical protein